MNAMDMNGQIVLIGVCTYKRQRMLRDCLDSLTQQLIPPNISAAIVVVDNEPVPAADAIVDEFLRISPIPIYYVHERRRGIACARNAVLDTARSMCADWIAFIDDDVTAEPDWLANLMAPEYLSAPVLIGQHPLPFWYIRRFKTLCQRGEPRTTTSANNVRLSSKLLDAGLRFDEKPGFIGDESVKFFMQALARGFAIKLTNKAITHHARRPKATAINRMAMITTTICYAVSNVFEIIGLLARLPFDYVYWLVKLKIAKSKTSKR